MGKQIWKPGNMLYPLPAVMVSAGNKAGDTNILTIAWTGTVCTNPPMAYISVRPQRHSYQMIYDTKEFVINLATEKMAEAVDYCGVRSGRDVDKWKEIGLTKEASSVLEYAPCIQESPVNIECRVTEVQELGSHHMFLAEVAAVRIDDSFMNAENTFELNKSGLLVYSHGEYLGTGRTLGTFGGSVRKKNSRPKKKGRHSKGRR